MNTSLLGAQITKFRKAAGLTQEDLGKAVGVTTQAVSRWENGGAPDVTLLPAIADKLHVTVDALFGREGGAPQDIEQTITDWIRTVQDDRRMARLCRIMLEICKVGMADIGPDSMGYLRSGEMEYNNTKVLMTSYFVDDYGEMLGTFAEDVTWVSIFPEPETGYAAYFASIEEYRNFFSVLAQPNVLEILLHLASIDEKYYTPGAIAKRVGMPVDAVEEALRYMVKAQLVRPLNMEDETGTMEAYSACKDYSLIPFLYLSRIMLQTPNITHLRWDPRETPMLKTNQTEFKN